MRISSILKRLLIMYESVYISGLGTFKTKSIPANVNNEAGTITPPTKEIFFDSNDNTIDNLISNALISEGITPEEASKEIATFVEEVKKDTKDGKFEIPGLGYFYKDKNNALLFNVTDNSGLSLESIGFESININAEKTKPIVEKNKPEVKKAEPEKQKETKVEEIKKDPEKNKEQKEVKKEPVEVKKPKSDKKTSLKFLYFVVPIVILLVLAGVFHKPIIAKFKDLTTKSNKKDTTNNKVIVKDTINNNNTNQNNLGDNLGNDEEYKKLLNAKISNTAEVYLGKNYKKFYIIVSSFGVKEYADNYMQELRKKGYNPEVLESSNYFRVSIGGYDNADVLLKDYNHYITTFSKDIWILINR